MAFTPQQLADRNQYREVTDADRQRVIDAIDFCEQQRLEYWDLHMNPVETMLYNSYTRQKKELKLLLTRLITPQMVSERHAGTK